MFMDYIRVIRSTITQENRDLNTHKDWFQKDVFSKYAREEVSGISLETIIVTVNLVSVVKHFFEELNKAQL